MNKNYSEEIPVNTIAKIKKNAPGIKTIEAILNYSKALQVASSQKGKLLIHLN